jgi:membrane protease YdiL (CAAX protease family)
MNVAPRFWLLLELVLVVVAYQTLGLGLLYLLAPAGLTHGALPATELILIITSVSLIFVLSVAYLSQRLRGKKFLDYGLHKAQWPSWKVLGLLIFWSLIFQLLQKFAIEKLSLFFNVTSNIPPIKSAAELFSFLVAAFAGGGFREELFYRAYLINKLTELLPKAAWSLWIAAALQILLFAYNHCYQGYLGVFQTGISAIVFTLIYLRTRSLWNAVLFHSVYDFWGILAIYLRC